MSNPIDKAQQRIDELQQKLKQAKALKSRIEARQKVVESKKKRTEETRRKILAGALALEMMDRDEGVKARFMTRLDKYLTRTDDRALFGLPPVA
ncbi:mobilization protein (plasmid) [Massilia cellulosiltytica]|uniref:mobilization protein n=1 Tax=Massilia cellulosiltytica TaxID=2683234 RepID=UPI0039B69B19